MLQYNGIMTHRLLNLAGCSRPSSPQPAIMSPFRFKIIALPGRIQPRPADIHLAQFERDVFDKNPVFVAKFLEVSKLE